MMPLRTIWLLPLLLLVGELAGAAPYIPDSDNRILERLPFRPSDPIARELADLRKTLRRDPTDINIAVRLARRYYELVAEEGDPRYLGYAQAALAPWWGLQTPPVEVQLLRASLRQFRHDFSGAIDDLDQVIARDPHNVQGLALRAIIYIVQAHYPQARRDCAALRDYGDPLIGLGCVSLVDGLTGNAASAYDSLNTAVQAAVDVAPPKMLWLQIRLAELAQRLGRYDVADTHYRRALALDIPDTFLLAAYADLLLQQKRPSDVVAMLKDKTRSDGLLLRLLIAERRLGQTSSRELENNLAARYSAAQMRGETVHQQEEARFSLEIRQDAKTALFLARENWRVQREPRDAQVFLEAAIAMHERDAARPVLQWLSDSGIEDPVLRSLERQLTGVKR